MNTKHLTKGLGRLGWLTLCILGALVLVRLFSDNSLRSSSASPVVPIRPSPPADEDAFLPTPDLYALPTLTPNSSPPTIHPTFSALPQEAPPTGQPPSPWPTQTPLPTLAPVSASRFSVQNIKFGAAIPLDKGLADPFGDIAWSPNGQTLAFSLATGGKKQGAEWPLTDVTLIDADGQNVRRLVPGFNPLWSPSGDLIAYLDYSDNLDELYVRIVDIGTRQTTLVTTIKRGEVFPVLAWISDTELLYYQDTVMLYDYRTASKSELLRMVTPSFAVSSPSPFQILATLPEQGLIAVASGHVLIILERDKSKIHVLKQLEGVDNPALAFSPDGAALVYVSVLTQQVKIVPTRGNDRVIELPRASRGTAWSVAWSPDGASLVYVDADGVHLVNRDGSGLRRVEDLPQGTTRLAWSPHGSIMLSINTSGLTFTLYSLPIAE